MSQEINLGQIKQEGAGINDVIAWNGTRWVPTDPPSGADGNGIYTGSGDIGQGIANSTTRAKIPDEGIFRFDYFDGEFAVRISDAENVIEAPNVDITLKSNDESVLFELDGSQKMIRMDLDGNDSVLDVLFSAGTLSGAVIRNNGGNVKSNPNEKALLELRSTTKGFLLPRMSTAQFNAFSAGSGGATTDGMMIYETGVDKIKLRANNAWVDIGGADGNGIYSGSGTIPNATAATLVDGGNFRINYFGGVASFYTDELETFIQSSNINRRVTVNTTSVILASDTSTATLSGTNFTVNKQTYISTTGGAPDVNSILDLSSVDKYLYLPRVITGNLSGTANNGAIVYDSTANVFKGRQGGAWITFADAAPGNGGIYGGSGSIPNGAIATLANGGTFGFDYFGGGDAILINDSTDSTTIKSKNGSNIISINNAGVDIKINGAGISIDTLSSAFDRPAQFNNNIYIANEVSPAALAANTNNWNPGGVMNESSHWLISSNSAVDLTGLDRVYGSRLLYLHNIGSFNITFKKENTNSIAENRFGFSNDIVLTPGAGITLLHSSSPSINRWKCLGTSGINVGTGGIYSGSGTIASGATATVSSGSFFKLEYAGGNDAFVIDSAVGFEATTIRGKSNGGDFSEIVLGLSSLSLLYDGFGLIVESGKTEVSSESFEPTKKVQFSSVISPAEFTANQNNYNAGDAVFLRVSASFNNLEITGIQHGKGLGNFADAGGRIIYITNIGVLNTIRCMGNNAASETEYRFISIRSIAPGDTQGLYYDPTTARWRWLNGA